jgi:hypothetical protein
MCLIEYDEETSLLNVRKGTATLLFVGQYILHDDNFKQASKQSKRSR